mmetsp:Transcript_16927/g.35300  ORF Transcript_16927/g.35300 Transcript_16927/m.35300 type:complete len:95 (+) Transcript_16927:970-1254(+)
MLPLTSENVAYSIEHVISLWLVIGIVFGLLAVFAVSYYAKKEFNAIVATEAENHGGEPGDQSNNNAEDDDAEAIAFEDEESHGCRHEEEQNADT